MPNSHRCTCQVMEAKGKQHDNKRERNDPVRRWCSLSEPTKPAPQASISVIAGMTNPPAINIQVCRVSIGSIIICPFAWGDAVLLWCETCTEHARAQVMCKCCSYGKPLIPSSLVFPSVLYSLVFPAYFTLLFSPAYFTLLFPSVLYSLVFPSGLYSLVFLSVLYSVTVPGVLYS